MTVPISIYPCPCIFSAGRRDWRPQFLSLIFPLVLYADGMSWTDCPRPHLGSYCRTKRKEGSSTKEGTGEEGQCMTVSACISSMHLDETSVPYASIKDSEQFQIDQYKYTHGSTMCTRFASRFLPLPCSLDGFRLPTLCPWADRSCPPRQTSV